VGKRGYFGIAMFHPKTEHNWGSLIRTANLMGADFIATIGRRFVSQCSDTPKTWKHIPVFHFDDFEDFKKHLPYSCKLVGIELDDRARDLKNYVHPQRAVYLLGAEDHGLPKAIMEECHDLISLRGEVSMNVACAGSIVLYHRVGLAA